MTLSEKKKDIIKYVNNALTTKIIDDKVSNCRKAAEAICKAVLLNHYPYGSDLICGNVKYDNSTSSNRALDLSGLITEVTRYNSPPSPYTIIDDKTLREKVASYLALIRVHGNKGSHDTIQPSDVVTQKDVDATMPALRNLLDWLYKDYFKEPIPEPIRDFVNKQFFESTTPYTDAELLNFSEALFDETNKIQEKLVKIEGKWWKSKDKTEKHSPDVESCPAFLDFNKLLITGAAGAGKTTILRNHYFKAVNNLKNTPQKQPIPLWIDLKSFSYNTDVTFLTAIKRYLITTLRNKSSRDFAIDHLERLYHNGKLVFYFDGFDEHKFDTEQNLSKEINDLWGSNNKIVVAARRELKPTDDFSPDTFIDILPISKEAIAEYFKNEEDVLEEIFKDKYKKLTESIFYLTLVKSFLEKNNHLPENLFDLYDFSFKEKYNLLDSSNNPYMVSYKDAVNGLELITKEYYDLKKNNKQAAISLSSLKIFQIKPELVHLLKGLEEVSFIRYSDNSYNSFYFNHKIYEDYFIARCFHSKKLSPVAKPGIDKDPIYLYYSIAHDKRAKDEFESRWSKIKKTNKFNVNEKTYAIFLENLDFITNAFKYRQDVIANRKDELINFLDRIVNQKDFLLKKYAVKAFALLSQNEVEKLLQKNPSLFTISSIREELLLICRNYKKLELLTEKKIVSSFIDRELSRDRNNINNYVSYSTALKPVLDFFSRSEYYGKIISKIFVPYLILHAPFFIYIFFLMTQFNLFTFLIYFLSFINIYALSMSMVIYFNHISKSKNWISYTERLRYYWSWKHLRFTTIAVIIFTIIPITALYLYSKHQEQTAVAIVKIIYRTHVLIYIATIVTCILFKALYEISLNYILKGDSSKLSYLKSRYADHIPTRKDVEDDFPSFLTAEGRVKYIEFIKYKLANKKFIGIWSDGKRPYSGDYDEASFQLAEIDEKAYNN